MSICKNRTGPRRNSAEPQAAGNRQEAGGNKNRAHHSSEWVAKERRAVRDSLKTSREPPPPVLAFAGAREASARQGAAPFRPSSGCAAQALVRKMGRPSLFA
jgi:hypothetical protein